MTLEKWLVITPNHGVMDLSLIRVIETLGSCFVWCFVCFLWGGGGNIKLFFCFEGGDYQVCCFWVENNQCVYVCGKNTSLCLLFGKIPTLFCFFGNFQKCLCFCAFVQVLFFWVGWGGETFEVWAIHSTSCRAPIAPPPPARSARFREAAAGPGLPFGGGALAFARGGSGRTACRFFNILFLL